MDILTGLMIWAAEALTLAVLLFSRWHYERDPLYLSWGSGFALHGIGAALVALRGDVPDFVSIQLANTMVLAGIGLWAAGLMQLERKPVEPYVAIPALIWIAGMFLNPVREDFSSRAVLHHVAAMVGHAIIIGILLRHRGLPGMTRRVFAGIVTIQFLSCALIAILVLVNRPETFDAAPHSAWLFLPTAFVFVGAIMCGARLLTERSETRLKALAVTDPLTGILNRRGLLDEFHSLRNSTNPNKPLIALLHFDLDSFKQINDLHGHQAGDAALVAFSQLGAISLRNRGAFGRMGGEEFAAIVRTADMVEAASIAEAVRLTLKQQTIRAGEHEIRVTVSVGISLGVADSADLDVLLTSADKALYLAKEAGRDRTAIGMGTDAQIVPSADRQGEEIAPSDLRANRQVEALKRVAAIGNR